MCDTLDIKLHELYNMDIMDIDTFLGYDMGKSFAEISHNEAEKEKKKHIEQNEKLRNKIKSAKR